MNQHSLTMSTDIEMSSCYNRTPTGKVEIINDLSTPVAEPPSGSKAKTSYSSLMVSKPSFMRTLPSTPIQSNPPPFNHLTDAAPPQSSATNSETSDSLPTTTRKPVSMSTSPTSTRETASQYPFCRVWSRHCRPAHNNRY